MYAATTNATRRLYQRKFNSLQRIFSLSNASTHGHLKLPHQYTNVNYVAVRHRSSLPFNTGLVFVPQQEAWVVERMGRFAKVLEPGANFLLPVLDRVSYVQNLKEMVFEIPQQSAVTADNVTLTLDGVLYLKVFDPYKASYNIDNPEFACTQLAQTTMRSEIGKIQLDSVFRERESLNTIMVGAINKATSPWGISCLRYEIRDIKLPERVQVAMQLQVEAERKKRAQILESEGQRDAEINSAEGIKRSTILRSEASKIEQTNQAQGLANATLETAQAKAKAIDIVANAIREDHSIQAATFMIAEQYVKAFSSLAKTNNTLVLPSNAGDVNSMIAQAFQVYKTLSIEPRRNNDNDNHPETIDKTDDNIREYYSDPDEAKFAANDNNSDLVRRSEHHSSVDSKKSGQYTKKAESFFTSKKLDKKTEKK